MTFEEWFDQQDYIIDDGCYQEKYLAAKDAWEYKEQLYKEVIERLENYPTCASCYIDLKSARVATNLKNRFIEILEEELL